MKIFELQVFDVVLNGEIPVIPELDIFEKVGRGVAHEEYIPFKVQNKKIFYNEYESEIGTEKISLEFIKVLFVIKRFTHNYCIIVLITIIVFLFQGQKDNPKINAIVVVKGDLAGMTFKFYFYHSYRCRNG